MPPEKAVPNLDGHHAGRRVGERVVCSGIDAGRGAKRETNAWAGIAKGETTSALAMLIWAVGRVLRSKTNCSKLFEGGAVLVLRD